MRSVRRHSCWRPRLKSMLVMGVIAVMILALTGCGRAPEVDGQIIIAQGVDATTLDPNMHAEGPTNNVLKQIYDSLLMRSEDGEMETALAQSFTVVDDTTWEFELRDDVTFHNGESFDAESVKYTVDRILDPEKNSPQAGDLSAVDEVQIVDQYTVRFVTSKPYPTLAAQLVGIEMVPPQYTEEKGDEYLASNPVGTGPYEFVRWEQDDEIVLQGNEKHWRGTPSIETVVFRVVPENSTPSLSFRPVMLI